MPARERIYCKLKSMFSYSCLGVSRVAVATICAALVIACGEATQPDEPPQVQPIALPLQDRVVFQTNRADTLFDLSLMTLDGTIVRQLTDTSTRDVCPALSPDGNWIAFHQLSQAMLKTPVYPARQDSLVLMRADATNRVAIAQLEQYATVGSFCPKWSASSERLVTASAIEEPRVRSNQGYRARVLDKSGNVISTYNFGDLGVTLRSLSLSPDGSRYVASVANHSTSGPPSGFRVYSMKTDGTDRQTIGDGGDGVWSPTGSAIAWNCFGVCVVQPPSTTVKAIYAEATSFPSGNTIAFSRDGSYLAFGCGLSAGARRSLCFANVSSGAIEEIPVAAEVARIVWLQDNSAVAFECTFGKKEICLAKRGSGTFRNLTNNSAQDSEPSAR